VIVTNEVRTAWKEDAREDADIEPEPILMKKTVVCTENSNSDVVMVKPAEDRV
jgi:hypothetical protein